MELPPADSFRLEDVLQAQRARLVRLCTHFSGSATTAEDLAQETLIEAWRHRQKLQDPTSHAQWLSAIARNVCLRWRREHRRQQERVLGQPEDAGTTLSWHDSLADDLDLEEELERKELAELLERAMSLLALETRQILMQHYIDELPQTTMAAQRGLSEGTMAVRLHRGKIALRRVLTRSLGEEAISYGLLTAEAAQWQETRIWCPLCGQRRLLARFLAATSDLSLRCAGCSPAPHTELFCADLPAVFQGVKGYRTMLARLQTFMDGYYATALPAGVVACCSCGRPARLEVGLPEHAPAAFHGVPGLHIRCLSCQGPGVRSWIRLKLLALSCPEGRRFWREHARIRALPEQEIDFAGRPALRTSFESLPAQARFDVVYARDDGARLAIRVSAPGLDR